MKSKAVHLSALLLVLLICGGAAFAWAPGTHTFIASHLKPRSAGFMDQQMYGAVAADIDEFFTSPVENYPPYFYATHYQPMDVWNAAQALPIEDRALAYGWVSHNEAWGADHNAHIGSFLYGPDKGYVIRKAQVLCGLLQSQLHAAGMDQYSGIITDMNCHFIVEYGMDILMTYRDPKLGAKVLTAATMRDNGIANLLIGAFPITTSPYVSMGMQFAFAEPTWKTICSNTAWC